VIGKRCQISKLLKIHTFRVSNHAEEVLDKAGPSNAQWLLRRHQQNPGDFMRRSFISICLVGVALSTAIALPAAAKSDDDDDLPRLNILLTNDDGWRGAGGATTPFIVTLRNTLEAAGHNVVVVAPDNDATGTGTRLSIALTVGGVGPLRVLSPEPDVYTVSGTPTDSVFLALSTLLPEIGFEPDLVVSGPNPGGNFSYITNHSGTAGGATAALELGMPSIAFSIDGARAAYLPFSDNVADYAVDLIDTLIDKADDGDALLPFGTALNVNYPAALDASGAEIPAKGTRLTTVDRSTYLNVAYTKSAPVTPTPTTPSLYELAFTPNATPGAPGSDREALAEGYVSVSPISADRTTKAKGLNFLKKLPG
jgi:5'-nucleotidase